MYKSYKSKTVLTSLLLLSQLQASDMGLGIDTLLNDIEKKTDLSEKTKLENSGISLIYTRDDLSRMQAKYLKDVLKSSSELGYSENRYGGPDPLNYGDFTPFISTSIRVFIDNQEISSGIYGSGMLVMGDLNIGFVDHIEIYTQTPTYEFSTEPTIMLVKLYSKSALKDEGEKAEINLDSYGSKRVSGFSAQELSNGWSYFAYASLNDQIRSKPKSFDTELSKDKRTAHVFSTISNKNNNILLEVNSIRRDAFIGPSYDATPNYSKLNTDLLHLGYDGNYKNISFLLSYDYMSLNHDYRDDMSGAIYTQDENGTAVQFADSLSFIRDVTTQSNIFTAELKYKQNLENHELIVGLKHRLKEYSYKKYYETKKYYFGTTKTYENITEIPSRDSNIQAISTLFLEDKYSLADNLIVTLGLQGVNVKNIDAIHNENNSYLSYRYGLTYLKNDWIFKTLGGHFEVYLEPYLVDNTINVVDKEIKNTLSDSIFESISYKKDSLSHELILGYILERNYLVPSQEEPLKLDNYAHNIHAYIATLRNKYKYRQYDELFLEIAYLETRGMQNIAGVESYKIAKAILRNFNTYKKFDFFNEVIYERNNINDKNYFDVNIGAKYHYSNSLSLALKGENILDRAVETSFFRINALTGEKYDSLNVTPYDQKATLTMEYLF